MYLITSSGILYIYIYTSVDTVNLAISINFIFLSTFIDFIEV